MKTLILILGIASMGATAAAQDKVELVWFGNEKCPMCSTKVDQRLFTEKDGQKIWFCSKDCKKKATADAAASSDALAKAYPAASVVDVKNTTCPVSGMPAKEDKTAVFQGQKVRLCCPKCAEAFKAEPNRFVAMAKNPALKPVKNAKCPVMKDEEVVKDLYITYKGQLIGICCTECVETFAGDPPKYQKVLDGAKSGN